MNQKITYYRKENYGNTQFYAIEHQSALRSLTGRKTLSIEDMRVLKIMGFELIEVLNPNK